MEDRDFPFCPTTRSRQTSPYPASGLSPLYEEQTGRSRWFPSSPFPFYGFLLSPGAGDIMAVDGNCSDKRVLISNDIGPNRRRKCLLSRGAAKGNASRRNHTPGKCTTAHPGYARPHAEFRRPPVRFPEREIRIPRSSPNPRDLG